VTDGSCSVEDLYASFRGKLRTFIVARTRDDALADDIVQEAFIKLADYCARGGSCTYRRSLLFKVAANLVADHFRAQTARAEPLRPEHEEVAQPEQEDSDTEWLECFGSLIERLPQPYREAVQLADIGQMRHQDIATRAGVSVSGVNMRVQRGRAMLRELLLQMCEVERDRRGGITQCQPRQ